MINTDVECKYLKQLLDNMCHCLTLCFQSSLINYGKYLNDRELSPGPSNLLKSLDVDLFINLKRFKSKFWNILNEKSLHKKWSTTIIIYKIAKDME